MARVEWSHFNFKMEHSFRNGKIQGLQEWDGDKMKVPVRRQQIQNGLWIWNWSSVVEMVRECG